MRSTYKWFTKWIWSIFCCCLCMVCATPIFVERFTCVSIRGGKNIVVVIFSHARSYQLYKSCYVTLENINWRTFRTSFAFALTSFCNALWFCVPMVLVTHSFDVKNKKINRWIGMWSSIIVYMHRTYFQKSISFLV